MAVIKRKRGVLQYQKNNLNRRKRKLQKSLKKMVKAKK